MIPELGHFALILALAVALVQGTLPLVGASRGDARLMALGRTAALTQAFLVILAFGALTQAYVTSDFSVANVVANSHSAKPLIYKISGVWGNHEGSMLLVGADPVALWRRRRHLRRQPARHPAQPRARHPGADRRRLPGLPALHLEPLRARLARADRRQRPQPAAAGSRPRLPSAAALSRLCRLLGDLRLRHRRPAGGPGRRRLGALGAAVDSRRLVLPDARHRARQLVGLLHPRLGRLLVLGSRRECLADALAGRHRAAAFGHRRREARRAEELDRPSRHPRLLAVAARHLPGALRRAHLGACLRPGSGARHVHPGLPAPRHRRRPRALRLAGAEADARRAVSADQPRRRPDPEQPAALHARRHGASGHALPALPRPAHRQQGLGRPALLQRHLRADLRAAVRRALRRPVPGLEARRAVAGAAAAAPGLHRLGGRRHRRGLRRRRPRHPGRARLRLRRLADPGQPVRIRRPPAPRPRALRRLAAPPARHAARRRSA